MNCKYETGNQRFQGRVLAVDDQPANLYLIKIVLERLGVEVVTAEDGVQAVDKAISEHFDLIIMDIMMPNMDGYETVRLLQTKQVNVPVMAWTSDSSGDSVDKCLQAGFSEYMVKPLDFLLLQEIIAKYLPVKNGTADDTICSHAETFPDQSLSLGRK
jgi:two-component system chemotaxis sensor kinase CheA